MDGLTGGEGAYEPSSQAQKDFRALREQQVTGVLNRAAAICLAFGVFCLFYGVAIASTDPAMLGPTSPLAEAIDWFGQIPVALAHLLLGVAMIMAVRKRSRLIVALCAAIATFGLWTILAVIPYWLDDAPGVSPTGIAVWGWFAGMCAYSIYKVLRIDRDFGDLWGVEG